MHKFLLISLAFCCGILGTNTQSCGIEGQGTTINIEAIEESTPGDTIIAQFQTFEVKSTATVQNPHNVYLGARRFTNGVYEIFTTDLFSSFVTTERANEIVRTAQFTCNDDSTVRYTFIVPIIEANNNPPVFSQPSYDVTFQLPLIIEGNYSLIQPNIVVSDADVNPAFADLHIVSSNRYFVPSVRKLWDTPNPDVYSYNVDFLVHSSITAGSYSTIVVADDNKHHAIVQVNFEVLASEPPVTEPETTEEATTELDPETTQEPTTEEETQEPTTEEETPEPEPTDVPTTEEPPTEPPTTEEATTTTTTTTEAPIEGCGIVGVDPSETVQVSNLNPILPTNTELWRGVLYNVNYTTTTSHPHNKYLAGYRSGSGINQNYWLSTTLDYNSFLDDNGGTNVIQRTANLYCNGGNVVQYKFLLEINDGPEPEPTIPPTDERRKPYYL